MESPKFPAALREEFSAVSKTASSGPPVLEAAVIPGHEAADNFGGSETGGLLNGHANIRNAGREVAAQRRQIYRPEGSQS